jgi:hypothetical protein
MVDPFHLFNKTGDGANTATAVDICLELENFHVCLIYFAALAELLLTQGLTKRHHDLEQQCSNQSAYRGLMVKMVEGSLPSPFNNSVECNDIRMDYFSPH